MEEINTDGGTVTKGNIHTSRDFVGRDSVSVVDNSITVGQLNVNIHPTNSKNSIRTKKQSKPKSINATIQVLHAPLSLFIRWSIPFVGILVIGQLAGGVFVLFTGIWDLGVILIAISPLFSIFLFYRYAFVNFYFRLERVGFYDDFDVSERNKIKKGLREISFKNMLIDSYAHWVTETLIETNKTKANKRRRRFF